VETAENRSIEHGNMYEQRQCGDEYCKVAEAVADGDDDDTG